MKSQAVLGRSRVARKAHIRLVITIRFGRALAMSKVARSLFAAGFSKHAGRFLHLDASSVFLEPPTIGSNNSIYPHHAGSLGLASWVAPSIGIAAIVALLLLLFVYLLIRQFQQLQRNKEGLEGGRRLLSRAPKREVVELEKVKAKLSQEIQQRRRAEAQAASYSWVIERTDDAVFCVDLNGIISTWNAGAEHLYGYTAQEAIGEPVSLFTPPERVDETQQILLQGTQGISVQQFETVRVTKNGMQRDVSITTSSVRDIAGEIIGVAAIVRDISERKQAKEALSRSEEDYRLLFEANPLPTLVYDRGTHCFLAANDAAIRHYGYSRAEFLKLTLQALEVSPSLPEPPASVPFHPDDSRDCRHRKKDGSIIDVEVTSHPVKIRGNEAVLVVVNDVTDRTRAEESVRQSEERFSTAFRSSPFAITISTLQDGRYIDVNDEFLKMLGYTRREIIGRTSIELGIWQDLGIRAKMVSVLGESGRVSALETHFRTQSGDSRLVLVSAGLLRVDVTSCVLAIIQDVTEARRLEEQLRQSQRMEAIGRLAGGVAHDFSNLLGVIIGYSELAQESLQAASPVRRHVEQIKIAAERAALLTRQLLAFTRQQVMQPRILELNSVITTLSKMLLRVIGEDIALVFRAGENLGNVRADLGQIEHALMNLVVNARDAMPEGGKIFIETQCVDLDEAYATEKGIQPGTYVMVSVSDTGCGMDPKTQSKIFEPFFTTKKLGEGTGLGLSMVYGVVRQSGGDIAVYSEPLKGSTFKLYFPRVEERVDPYAELAPETTPAGGNETILLVEDDSNLRRLACDFLSNQGYHLLEAENAMAASELANRFKKPIHLLLTDVILPGMSGSDLAMRFRFARPDMKVLYMSGYAGELIAHHGVLQAENAFLPKPFTRKSLLSAVRSTLDSQRSAGVRM